MYRLKQTFLSLVAIGLVVEGYFLLEYLNIHVKILRNTRPTNTLTLSNISCSERPIHGSEHTAIPHHDVGKSDQSHYRVQLYSRRVDALKNNVSCRKDCTMEITVVDDKNRYAGMDAVVFHIMPWRDGLYLPKSPPPANMNPRQAWVYFSWESPWSNSKEPRMIAKYSVHAMWTYHRGSDLIYPYGNYNPGTPMAKKAKSVDEWLRGKTKFALIMVSNCKFTTWPRMSFVRQLQKYIPVDIYGACGNLTCWPRRATKCDIDLVRQYKFYLALENAECEDYITEKVWVKPLKQGVVPVVNGPKREVYEEMMPPNSFIYVGDYKNMSELANYLKLLDSNPELYVQYLKWQHQGTVTSYPLIDEPFNQSTFCDLIPLIDRVKKGGLRRKLVGKTSFQNTCRKPNPNKKAISAFGVENWNPW